MTITNVPDPRGLTLARWGAELALQDANVPLTTGLDWRRWAATVASFAKFGAQNLPDPYQFTDWTAWATALRKAANT